MLQKELWSKPLASWYLYDFANSLLVINLTVYFSQWVVVDRGLTDFWFALPFMLATAVLVFLSPYVGALGDRKGNHSQIFILTTLGAVASGLSIFLAGRLAASPPLGVALALVFYGLFNFFLQLAFVPYNAFLKHIARPEDYGKTSGFGLTFNQLGYLAGLLLSSPIIQGTFTLFGQDRLAPLVPAAFGFFLFALPGFRFLRAGPVVERISHYQAGGQLVPETSGTPFWQTFWTSLKESRKYPGVFPFLIAFYLFSNAITALTFFSAIYLQNVFGLPDPFKVRIFISVIIAYALGSFLGGLLSDRWGHRRTLLTALAATALAILPIALVRQAALTVYLFPAFGLAIGVVYASARAYFAARIPQAESGKFFGLYALSERFGSAIGPAVWGLVIWALSGFYPWNYRAAALAMAALVAVGIIPLISKKTSRPTPL